MKENPEALASLFDGNEVGLLLRTDPELQSPYVGTVSDWLLNLCPEPEPVNIDFMGKENISFCKHTSVFNKMM